MSLALLGFSAAGYFTAIALLVIVFVKTRGQ